jgi:hypothetical protein
MLSFDSFKLGNPLSELELRGNTMIKILSDEDIKGMRVACKVGYLDYVLHWHKICNLHKMPAEV